MDAEALFRERWKWQALNPRSLIDQWPKMWRSAIDFRKYSNSIPCYVNAQYPDRSGLCGACPVKWGTEDKTGDVFCLHVDSPMAEWYRVRYRDITGGSTQRLTEVAWIISELPWSEVSKSDNN